MKHKILVLFLAFLLAFTCVSCGILDEEEPENTDLIGTTGDKNQTWAIYFYLCGSDLESENGAASDDLQELSKVKLPENVQVIIQTGGAKSWSTEGVAGNKIQRYLYDSEGLSLLEEQKIANMGDPDTLADFLGFCKENYAADKQMALFWNHGGGSVSGAAFDENFEFDALTLSEFQEAFGAVYDLSSENPPFEVVGFDTCLMATIDTASAFSDIARYLVASEELEPGTGWFYDSWLQALADDPGMDGARLGQHICDSYFKGCEESGYADEVTLSVVDLKQAGSLLQAYEKMGKEALQKALEDPSFFTTFGRKAKSSENYGGNTRDQGYSNMVDLGHLAENCKNLLPETAENVQKALDSCVLYQVRGDYRSNAKGLSCYYSYNGDLDDFNGFVKEGCSQSFKHFFQYELTGDLSDEGLEYAQQGGFEAETVPEIPNLDPKEDVFPLYIDEEDYVTLEVPKDLLDCVEGVYFQLAYVNEEADLTLLLGRDNDLIADWDKGLFRDNFRGVWGAIDGHLVYMEVYAETDAYTAFAVPILLNGEACNLSVIYNYKEESYEILGARKEISDCGMADKNLVQLKPGDEITTLHYASSLSSDEDYEQVPVDTFQVTKNTRFGEENLGDGTFVMVFMLTDAQNNTAYSEMVEITVSGDTQDIQILD